MNYIRILKGLSLNSERILFVIHRLDKDVKGALPPGQDPASTYGSVPITAEKMLLGQVKSSLQHPSFN